MVFFFCEGDVREGIGDLGRMGWDGGILWIGR